MLEDANDGKVKEREKQVNEQIIRLGSLVDSTNELMDVLYTRLEVVLRQEPDNKSPETAQEPVELVALAYDIKCKTDRIVDQKRRIKDILDRLEI
jgi:hypothetical protein